MKKKIIKYSIVAVLIVAICIIAGILLNKKDVKFISLFTKTQTALDGSETTGADSGENYVYHTDGDDSANYEDGDTSKETRG